MYFKCPVCKKDSWVPVNPTIEVVYDFPYIVFPSIKIDRSRIKWYCDCHKNYLKAKISNVDLPDSTDIGGDTAALLLQSVLDREDLPPAVRFEATVWQFVVTELTEADVLATIAVDEHLAKLLSFHDFGEDKRDVVTDDVIRKIEDAVQTTLQGVDKV